jgi:hypothetical protein
MSQFMHGRHPEPSGGDGRGDEQAGKRAEHRVMQEVDDFARLDIFLAVNAAISCKTIASRPLSPQRWL